MEFEEGEGSEAIHKEKRSELQQNEPGEPNSSSLGGEEKRRGEEGVSLTKRAAQEKKLLCNYYSVCSVFCLALGATGGREGETQAQSKRSFKC